MSETGYVLSYAIGLIFTGGGLAFLLLLDDNRFLFGVPYLVMGLVFLVGLHMGRRRKLRREAMEATQTPHPEGAPDPTPGA